MGQTTSQWRIRKLIQEIKKEVSEETSFLHCYIYQLDIKNLISESLIIIQLYAKFTF